MKEQFSTYGIALKLKGLGFNEECLAYFVNENFKLKTFLTSKDFNYNSDFNIGNLVSAPLWQQVVDWFREKHDIHIEVHLGIRETKLYKGEIYKVRDTYKNHFKLTEYVDSYYMAREQSISKAIEYLIK